MESSRLKKIFADQMYDLLSEPLNGLCDRAEESQISLDSNLAQVVIGVRRCGKSTICEKLLRQSGKQFAYVNFDDDRLSELKTDDFDRVLDALYQLYGDFHYLFLDEVQNVKEWQLFCNRLLRQKMRLFITGSNSKLLSHELTTHLTGRHSKIELYPYSFKEYAQFNGVDTNSFTTKATALRKATLVDYLKYGGFPELINIKDKRRYIDALLESIIKNDVANRFKIRYVDVLRRMAAYLSDIFCQEFIASKVGELFNISDHTAENYYSHLKEAFLLIGLPKFSYKSRERVTNEKVYVVDTAIVSERDGTFSQENLGWRLENVVLVELLRRNRPQYKDVFYYRESNWEVDFLVTKNGNVDEIIQVSYDISSEKVMKREINGLLKAAKKFKCSNLILINDDIDRTVEKEGNNIRILPAADWLVMP